MAKEFKIEHYFPNIPLDKFIAHLNDPKLNCMLEKGLYFSERKMLNKQEQKDSIEWQFKVRKCGELPIAIKKIIKNNTFGWIETSRLVRKENCIYWRINPENPLLKFHGEGVWLLKAHGQGCKRIIEGTITVDIPMVGKMVEGLIVNELLKTYEVEPLIQEEFYSSIL